MKKLRANNPWILSIFAHIVVVFVPLLISIIIDLGRHKTPQGVPITIIGAPIARDFQKKIIKSNEPSDTSQLHADQPQELGLSGEKDGVSQDILDRYLYELRHYLERHKDYPTLSKQLGESGTVEVSFTILASGEFANARIASQSSFHRLNTAALDMIQKAERFKPLPVEIRKKMLDVQLPVIFNMR